MSVYTLLAGIGTVQTVANVGNADGTGGPNPFVIPIGTNDNPNAPPFNEAFQLTVVGNGSVSASAQIVASNDGQNWVNQGTAIAASGATTMSSATGTAAAAFKYWGAFITAISGTNAKATVTMSA